MEGCSGASSNTSGFLFRAGRTFLGLELVRAQRSRERSKASLGVGRGDGELAGQQVAEPGVPRLLRGLVCQPPSSEGDR